MPSPAIPFRRRHPAHAPYRDCNGTSVILFITANSKLRKPIFAKPDAAEAIVSSWREARAWLVGRYIIMPDHVHLFAAPVDPDTSVEDWVAFWKARASSRWPRREEQPIWQRDFWDTQLRASERYEAVWEYVRSNPVRRGLVPRPEEWPYGGELNVLDWHSS